MITSVFAPLFLLSVSPRLITYAWRPADPQDEVVTTQVGKVVFGVEFRVHGKDDFWDTFLTLCARGRTIREYIPDAWYGAWFKPFRCNGRMMLGIYTQDLAGGTLRVFDVSQGDFRLRICHSSRGQLYVMPGRNYRFAEEWVRDAAIWHGALSGQLLPDAKEIKRIIEIEPHSSTGKFGSWQAGPVQPQ